MPYFRIADGRGKGHVNDEATMAKLEEFGYVRMEGVDLFLHIAWSAIRKWGIPAVCGLVAYYFYPEFLVGLIVFATVQEILD